MAFKCNQKSLCIFELKNSKEAMRRQSIIINIQYSDFQNLIMYFRFQLAPLSKPGIKSQDFILAFFMGRTEVEQFLIKARIP